MRAILTKRGLDYLNSLNAEVPELTVDEIERLLGTKGEHTQNFRETAQVEEEWRLRLRVARERQLRLRASRRREGEKLFARYCLENPEYLRDMGYAGEPKYDSARDQLNSVLATQARLRQLLTDLQHDNPILYDRMWLKIEERLLVLDQYAGLLRRLKPHQRFEEGRRKGGKAQRERAARENAPIIEAYRLWRAERPDTRAHPKATFIGEWNGRPARSERQMYQILRSL